MSKSVGQKTALCVGRHRFLSEHLGRFFRDIGLETTCVVGLEEAAAHAHREPPDLVICEYDLLATIPLDVWETDPLLSRLPIFAVSLTRRPEEVHLLDVNNIGGFLYLPTLTPGSAMQILGLPRPSSTYALDHWRPPHDARSRER